MYEKKIHSGKESQVVPLEFLNSTIWIHYFAAPLLLLLKLRHCEKVTKFEKISLLFWRLLRKSADLLKQEGDFYKSFWPWQKNWTLLKSSQCGARTTGLVLYLIIHEFLGEVFYFFSKNVPPEIWNSILLHSCLNPAWHFWFKIFLLSEDEISWKGFRVYSRRILQIWDSLKKIS